MATFTNIKNLNNIGPQKICIDSSGADKENVYVCDAEGFVLKFNKNSLLFDEKPEVIEVPDSTTASIAWNGENICLGYSKIDFVVGSEKQVVGRVKNGNFEADAIGDQLEFQLTVTTVDANAVNVVGGSSDYAVKCTSLKSADAELKTRSLEGEPLCVKLDPRNEYVAVSTVDGNVTIINIDTFSIAHTLKNVFPKFETIDVSKPLVQMSWSKDGTCLFVPSRGGVKIFRRNGWEDSGSYALKTSATADFSVTAVSPCGTYLAASTMDNKVAVWKNEDLSLVSCEEFRRSTPGTTVITSIEFSPFSPKKLIIADSNRGVCLFNAFGPSSDSTSSAAEKRKEIVAEESDDDDLLILNRTVNKKENLFNDEAMEDDEDTRMSSDIAAIKKQYGYGNENIGDLEEFGFKLGEPEELRPLSPQRNVQPPVYSEPPAPRKVLIPERFVCSSTPFDVESEQRFLKYNQAGIVRSYVNESAKVSSIDIEFHNKNIHGDIHIDNFEANYELADISSKVVAMASMESRKKEKELDKDKNEVEDLEMEVEEPTKTDKKGTSVLHVIPIQAFAGQRWSVTMPRGDGIIDVLVSDTQVVVLTKKRNVRVFTIGGVQRQIFTHPAPILTAACFDDRIAIASVAGSEFYESKKMPQWRFEIVEYSLNQRTWYREPRNRGSAGAVTRFDVPVETGEQLDWIGYSSYGKLAVMDSVGDVHVLSAPGLWIPIFQGSSVRRAPSDTIFPIGITGKGFRYIYCRGSRAPLVNGTNAPSTVDWKMPFCQPESKRTEYEHSLFLSELSVADAILDRDGERSSVESKELTKTIVNLFAWLAKTNSDGQAAEVAALAAGGTSAKTIQLLCNYASKSKKLALANKVAEIGRQMDGEDERKEEELKPRPTKRSFLGSRKAKEPSPMEKKLSDDEEKEEEEEDQKQDTTMNFSLNVSMSQPVAQLERLAKNPFARGGEKSTTANDSASSSQSTRASSSIFDQLETTSTDHRKRARENEPTVSSQPPVRKQARLNFGGGPTDERKKKPTAAAAAREKENVVVLEEEPVKKSVSPYELWLSETRSSLRFEFDGEEADFSKFCIQTFRALSKDQKDEWKAKAHASAPN
ncbi:unnamed protein product [Caenorhabditis sp. 36 PRJEB53466]|nr:unnamed protein product [Caenorhabditis sp. 36 PRJEB53466]